MKRIYCPLPSEQYLECSCIAVYKCILLHNTLCVDMQISCSALNAPADSTDGEQQKMEEPTSTRVADKVPAIRFLFLNVRFLFGPLTSPFSIFFLNVRFLFGPPTLFLLDNLNNRAFLLKKKQETFSLTNEIMKISVASLPKND